MPELPDVEVYRQYLQATVLHQPIEKVHVESPSILFETTAQGLGRALKHKCFHTINRHGKYLLIFVEDKKWLVMHFGMTGDIKYFHNEVDTPNYTRLLINFENGYHLAYISPRKLGRIGLTDSIQRWIVSRQLGPDVFDLSEGQFVTLAEQQRGAIKSWLMDQNNISGIGNIYSDEILFQSGIHPKKSLSSFNTAALRNLYKTMNIVLKKAISAHADPDRMPPGFLLPCRKKGSHCPACDTPLESVKVAGRTAWYCPHCQHG